MARPIKEGLDYFPLDIGMDGDDKLSVVIGKFGMQGLGIVVKMMMEIYKNGYFYSWGEREQYVFANRVNVDINSVMEVINECVKWGFFNQKLYESYQLLTSKGFQKRYIEASKRRKSVTFIQEYTLIDLEEASKTSFSAIQLIDVNDNLINVYINPNKGNSADTETPQSKVKESKVNKNKVNKQEIKDLCPDPHKADQHSPSDSEKVKYGPDNTYYKLAIHFKGVIDDMAKNERLEHLTHRANLQAWSDDFRKLVELDKHKDIELITSVMDWVVKNDFWRSNVLSAAKFRKQYPKLVLDMKKEFHSRFKPKIGTSGKTEIPMATKSNPDEPGPTDEEYERMMQEAAEMQASKDK